jgi:DNA-binding LacI/PurR family transcriptional regulator
MKQIARMAGVSLGTVSHVLNNSATVREPLRSRVLEVVDLLGYQPSQLARGLRRDKTDIIGMIIPDILNPFFPAVVRGAEDAAFGSGYRLVLCNTDNSESKEISYMNELRTYLPAGIIVIPSNISEMTMKTYDSIKGGSALVCLDRLPRHWKGDTVTFANEEGAIQATHHLIQLGHTRIATVTGPIHLTSAAARLTGFRRALKRANIPLPADYIQESNFDREGGYTAALRLLALDARPTAIFAQNDLMAMGVLMALRQLNLSCPKDVSIIGFDGLDLMELMDPPLSSVQQPGYQLGSVGVQLLLERVSDPNRKFRHHVLPTELRLRDSTAPPPTTSPRQKPLKPTRRAKPTS